MKFPIAVVATMISLAGVSAVEIDFNDGWEWRYGGEKEWPAPDLLAPRKAPALRLTFGGQNHVEPAYVLALAFASG